MRVSSILEPEGSSKEYRKNWARLIQKKARPPPKSSSENLEPFTDYSVSQLLPSDDYLYCDEKYAEEG